MADHVIVNGERVTLPHECESDMAARAAFIAKVLGTEASPAATPVAAPTPAPAPEEDA